MHRPPRASPARALALALMVTVASMTTGLGEDGATGAEDPFGPPRGPIPFPIVNVSSSYDEDRFPTVFADDEALRVVWDKMSRTELGHHVVAREFDGQTWDQGEDWVSAMDPGEQDFSGYANFSHEGSAVRFGDLVYYLFASEDHNITGGGDFDIVLRSQDPVTGRWGPMVEVTPNDEGEDRAPVAAVLGDRLVVLWRTSDPAKADGDDDDIVLRAFDGAAFSTVVPVSLEDDDGHDAKVDVVVVGGRLCVVWEHNNRSQGTQDWEVLYREWDGRDFTSPPVVVSPADGRLSRSPRVAALGNDTFCVWESWPPVGEQGAVGIRGRVIDGTVPGRPVNVTRPGSNADNTLPDVVSAGGQAYVLWSTLDDSLGHGPDLDIVMRGFDGEALGEVVELSHPRDGVNVREAFVSACVFQGNVYAVWWMASPAGPGSPPGIAVNEDVVMRRLTDLEAEVQVDVEGRPRVGDQVNVTVQVSTFYGAPVPAEGLDVRVAVQRDLVFLEEVELRPLQGGDGLTGRFVPEEAGDHVLTLLLEGREKDTASVFVYEASGDGDGNGMDQLYVYIAMAAAVLAALGLVYIYRRR